MKLLQCVMLAALAAPAMAQVTVEEIEYEGWARSIEIANPDVRLVVVPAIGRIMHYGFVGGENILWSDPELHGQVLPDGQPNVDEEDQYVWTNFGGDKVWPNQQSEFVKINGHSWPPDHAFDGAVHEVELLPQGVVISSPVSEYNGARSVREIRLAEQGTRVEILQADRKAGRCQGRAVALHHLERPPRSSRPSRPSIRSTRTATLICAIIPLALPRARPCATSLSRATLAFLCPTRRRRRRLEQTSDRWLAGIVGDVVMAEFFRRDGTQRYPDGGLSAEVYTCPDYTELELLSPWIYLQVGETLTHEIAWELYRLPADAKTPKARRQAAVEWLATQSE